MTGRDRLPEATARTVAQYCLPAWGVSRASRSDTTGPVLEVVATNSVLEVRSEAGALGAAPEMVRT